MKQHFRLFASDSKNYPHQFLFKILVAICMVSITLLIRTRQDLFVYENGSIGTFSLELIAILIIGILNDWKRVYHVIL